MLNGILEVAHFLTHPPQVVGKLLIFDDWV